MYKSRIVIFGLLAALLTGCSAGGQDSQLAPTESPVDLPYEIICDNGGYYLMLEDGIIKDEEVEGSFSEALPMIKFTSIEEMVQDIKTGNFTEDELRNLAKFPKDEDDRTVLCDLSKLYDAYAPERLDRKIISWYGDAYDFIFEESEGESSCCMHSGFSNAKKEKGIEELIACSRVPNFTLLSTEQVEDRNATVITFTSGNLEIEERKFVYYTIKDSNKELFVRECYQLSTDTVPVIVHIYGTEKGVNFSVELIREYQERPSVEYLMSFGVREYVETEVA